MRHLLEILKVDLGCKKEEKATRGLYKYALPADEGAEHFPGEVQRKDKLTESKEFLKAMGLIANEPPASTQAHQTVESPEETFGGLSEPACVESNPSDRPVTAENLDTSCTRPPTRSSTTCDADFETSESLRGIDELKGSVAELLPLSTDSTP